MMDGEGEGDGRGRTGVTGVEPFDGSGIIRECDDLTSLSVSV